MRYEVKKVSPDDMDMDITEKLSFWANPRLLKIYAKREKINFFYLCVIKSSKIIAIMPVFEKKKLWIPYVFQLRMHFYTPVDFFFKDETNLFSLHNEKIWVLQSLGVYLKKKYFSVILRIEHTVSDMRGFMWSGFKVEPLYTYKKIISSYDKDLLPPISKRQLKKAKENNLTVKEHWDINIIQTLLSELVNRKLLSKDLINDDYMRFYEDLKDSNFCTNILAYKDGKPVAFRLTLTDPKKYYSCELIAGANNQGNDLRANFLCLDFTFRLLHDFYVFDFCGANIESIAYFKSQFNSELVNYHKLEKSN